MAIIFASANGSSGKKVKAYMESIHPEMKITSVMAYRIADDMMDKTNRKQLSPLGKKEFARIIEEVLSENTYIDQWPYKIV